MSGEIDKRVTDEVAKSTNWRLIGTIAAGVIVLGFVAGMFFFGQQILNLDGDSAAQRLIGAGRGTLWAPIVAVLAFVILGLTGFPQFVMIAAAVVLFGPVYGFAVSWTGTMLSASLGYTLGQIFGADILRRFGGDRANALSAMVGNRGIFTTAMLRIVPTGIPFIVINLASGVSHIRLSQYVIGTGLGIVPKMAVIAFFGGSLIALFSGKNLIIMGLLLAATALWGGVWFWLRRSSFGTPRANSGGDGPPSA